MLAAAVVVSCSLPLCLSGLDDQMLVTVYMLKTRKNTRAGLFYFQMLVTIEIFIKREHKNIRAGLCIRRLLQDIRVNIISLHCCNAQLELFYGLGIFLALI